MLWFAAVAALGCGQASAASTHPAADAMAEPSPPVERAAEPRAGDQVVARSSLDLPRGYAQRAVTDLDAAYGTTTTPASIVEG